MFDKVWLVDYAGAEIRLGALVSLVFFTEHNEHFLKSSQCYRRHGKRNLGWCNLRQASTHTHTHVRKWLCKDRLDGLPFCLIRRWDHALRYPKQGTPVNSGAQLSMPLLIDVRAIVLQAA